MSARLRESLSRASARMIWNRPAMASCVSCWMPGPHERRPRNSGVRIAFKDDPALAGGPFPAQPELIFDGGLVLQVRAVPGVDRAIHRMSFARDRVRRRTG